MMKMIFTCLFFSILLIALELLFIWIVLLISDGVDDQNSKEEDEEAETEHDWEFMGFDNTHLNEGILRCIYQCKKCGKVISI